MKSDRLLPIGTVGAILCVVVAGSVRAYELDDNFSNGDVADTEQVKGAWKVVKEKGGGPYDEAIESTLGDRAGRLHLTGGRSESPRPSGMRLVAGPSPELNFFDTPLEFTVEGLELDSTPVEPGGPVAPDNKVAIFFEITPEGQSAWRSRDAVCLRIDKTGHAALGWKNDTEKKPAEFTNTLARRKKGEGVNAFRLRFDASLWELTLSTRTGEKTYSGKHGMTRDMWDGEDMACCINLLRMDGSPPGSRAEAWIDRVRIVTLAKGDGHNPGRGAFQVK